MKTEHESSPAAVAACRPPARYLYAVLPAREEGYLGPAGLAGADVGFVTEGRVTAAVSDLARGSRLRPERRNLAAHNGVLKTLMEQATVLPVAFGIVADSDAALRGILTRNQPAFLSQLARVEGKVEMGLRVSWDVPNIFEYLVNLRDELREARDRIFGGRHEPSQDDKIEMGRLFDRVLGEERDAHAERVEEVLSPIASELKRSRVRGEREVMNLACLVPRERLPRFEAAVFEAARLFDDSYAFDYNGPWAPHTFVEVELRT